MKNILIKGAMLCALILLVRTQTASENQGSLTAIGIFLERDATMLEHATATNERLLKVFPKGFALDASHRPHITLVQRFVRTVDLDRVYDAVGKVFPSGNVSGIKLEAYKYYYIPHNHPALSAIAPHPPPKFLNL